MPIYEYRCQACGHELEKLQRMSDDALKDCPACGQAALKRLISAAGFRLKGAGWYETDFKSGNKRNLADSGERGEGGKGEKSASEKSGSDKSTASPAPGKAEGVSKGSGAAAGSSGSSSSGSASKSSTPGKSSTS